MYSLSLVCNQSYSPSLSQKRSNQVINAPLSFPLSHLFCLFPFPHLMPAFLVCVALLCSVNSFVCLLLSLLPHPITVLPTHQVT